MPSISSTGRVTVTRSVARGHGCGAWLELTGIEHARFSPGGRRCIPDAISYTVIAANAGPAIPDDLLPQLFEPYRRGTSQPGSKGLGLGLFIAREIVRAHGGAIAVRSAAGEGTRFTVRLPRA